MSAGGFSQYIIGGAKSSLKVLLTFDCNTDQIAQDHRDKFNRHCQDGYDVIYKIQGSKSMCLIANPHGDWCWSTTTQPTTNTKLHQKSEEEHTIGSMTTYKESRTIFRIISLLKSIVIAVKYGKKFSVQQLMNLNS